jgi:hypothetical protein
LPRMITHLLSYASLFSLSLYPVYLSLAPSPPSLSVTPSSPTLFLYSSPPALPLLLFPCPQPWHAPCPPTPPLLSAGHSLPSPALTFLPYCA